MTRTPKSALALSGDRKLSALEAELAKVSEDFRLAKLAVRQAKVYAKVVKKEMKRLRKAWVKALEEEQDQAAATAMQKKTPAASATKARAKTKPVTSPEVTRRVAESPERVRKPRRKKEQRALVPPPGAPANEPQLDREIPATGVSAEE